MLRIILPLISVSCIIGTCSVSFTATGEMRKPDYSWSEVRLMIFGRTAFTAVLNSPYPTGILATQISKECLCGSFFQSWRIQRGGQLNVSESTVLCSSSTTYNIFTSNSGWSTGLQLSASTEQSNEAGKNLFRLTPYGALPDWWVDFRTPSQHAHVQSITWDRWSHSSVF